MGGLSALGGLSARCRTVVHASARARAVAVADRAVAAARRQLESHGRAWWLVDAAPDVLTAAARAPLDHARLSWMRAVQRWAVPGANEGLDLPFAEIPLWRGGAHAGDDARAAAFVHARLPAPAASILAVGADGSLAGFAVDLPNLDVLLAPATPATVAAVDAGDDGAPWIMLTLNALAAAAAVHLLLPPGVRAETVPLSPALEALLARAAGAPRLHAAVTAAL